MNNKPSISYLILIIAPLFFCCRGPVKEENKSNSSSGLLSFHIGDEKYFTVDTKQSIVMWTGSSLIGSNSHTGYVYISQGELMIENDQLVGGTLEIDMNTIEDKDHGSDNNLINHLKDPDFFDVKKFPFSKIAISEVVTIKKDSIKVAGKLTIKGITHPVTFPASLKVENGMIRANGKLVIDRTLWNVRYKSGKFFDLVANQIISDSLKFDIKIVAKK